MATSFRNHDVAKSEQSQPADDVVESKLTMPVFQAILEVINQPDLRNSSWKNLPTSRATSLSNHDVTKSEQSQPADDVVESTLTMPVLQAVLEVINQPDLRNSSWKNLPTSRATSFSNHDVAKAGQSQPADDVVKSTLTMPASSFGDDKPTRSEREISERQFDENQPEIEIANQPVCRFFFWFGATARSLEETVGASREASIVSFHHRSEIEMKAVVVMLLAVGLFSLASAQTRFMNNYPTWQTAAVCFPRCLLTTSVARMDWCRSRKRWHGQMAECGGRNSNRCRCSRRRRRRRGRHRRLHSS